MPMSTRKTGANFKAQIGGTYYPIKGTSNENAEVRVVDMRAGGDAAPQPVAIGMADGSNWTGEGLSTDYALLTLNGTWQTVTIFDGSTTIDTMTGLLKVKMAVNTAGEVAFNLDLLLGALPTQAGTALTLP